VGNIFKFGTEKSEKMNIFFKDAEGKQQPIYLASYGIGITRVMGVIVEKFADGKGLVWPESVAPFRAHLISLGMDEAAEKLYQEFTAAGIEVLLDDRDASAGEKFADSDLLGLPYRIVLGKRSFERDIIELKKRTSEDMEEIKLESVVEYFTK
jgi:prolyl-tRNA synthetase